MPNQGSGKRDFTITRPLIWCLSTICALILVAVIMVGIVLFLGYLTLKPVLLQISVTRAQLNSIYFDQTNLLTLQITILIKAQNDIARTRASFYNTTLAVGYGGQTIAYLVAQPFSVGPRKKLELNFASDVITVRLNRDEANAVNMLMRQGVMSLDVGGSARTGWRVGFFGPVRFWLHLNCHLQLPVDGTAIYPRCASSGHH